MDGQQVTTQSVPVSPESKNEVKSEKQASEICTWVLDFCCPAGYLRICVVTSKIFQKKVSVTQSLRLNLGSTHKFSGVSAETSVYLIASRVAET